MKGFVLLGFGLALGVALGVWVFFSGETADSPAATNRRVTVGGGMPEFLLTDLKGKNVSMTELKGMPVVINFWATWCPPCLDEMPIFQKYAQEYSSRVHFVGISVDQDIRLAQKFVQKEGITYPILWDQENRLTNQLMISSFPITFFIDTEGIVRAQHLGKLDEKLLDQYLATLGIIN